MPLSRPPWPASITTSAPLGSCVAGGGPWRARGATAPERDASALRERGACPITAAARRVGENLRSSRRSRIPHEPRLHQRGEDLDHELHRDEQHPTLDHRRRGELPERVAVADVGRPGPHDDVASRRARTAYSSALRRVDRHVEDRAEAPRGRPSRPRRLHDGDRDAARPVLDEDRVRRRAPAAAAASCAQEQQRGDHRALRARAISRSASRSLMESRLSWAFFPFPSASATFATPFLK